MKLLKPTVQRTKDIRLYGFDVETANDNIDFVMGSVYSDDFYQVFYNRDEMAEFLLFNSRFQGAFLVATNLQFDWCALYYNSRYEHYFRIVKDGSRFINVKAYVRTDRRHRSLKKDFDRHYKAVTFIDTLNYASISVEQLGKIIKVDKINKPDCVKECRFPENEEEWNDLEEYNLNDSRISYLGMKFFKDSFERLGANFRPTIASTSLSIWRNRYQKGVFFCHDKWMLDKIFNGYYGGNCHAYSRGSISDYNLYDFKSMYPSVMLNDYPDPNSVRHNRKNTLDYIKNYEGMSLVEVSCPYMDYPLLPYRYDNKLLFPYGNFKGWYCHNELREAMKLGYTIKNVHECFWYRRTCRPFKDFINDMYGLRQMYMNDNNDAMAFVIKIVMNSLYGKFGQRYDDKSEYIHVDRMLFDDIKKYPDLDREGNYFIVKKQRSPSCFCIPIWAAYTTAYARIKLHDACIMYNPIYVDTDSIMTKSIISSSSDLGRLEFKMSISSGIIVKPKCYMINKKPKIKGVGKILTSAEFIAIMSDSRITYRHFMRFSESVRRGFIPNQIVDVMKTIDLEDNKRVWPDKFDFNDFQMSMPIKMDGGFPEIHQNIYKSLKISCTS